MMTLSNYLTQHRDSEIFKPLSHSVGRMSQGPGESSARPVNPVPPKRAKTTGQGRSAAGASGANTGSRHRDDNLAEAVGPPEPYPPPEAQAEGSETHSGSEDAEVRHARRISTTLASAFSIDVTFLVSLNGKQRRLATVANGAENPQYPLQYKDESCFYSLGTLFFLRFFLCQPLFVIRETAVFILKQTYG